MTCRQNGMKQKHEPFCANSSKTSISWLTTTIQAFLALKSPLWIVNRRDDEISKPICDYHLWHIQVVMQLLHEAEVSYLAIATMIREDDYNPTRNEAKVFNSPQLQETPQRLPPPLQLWKDHRPLPPLPPPYRLE